MKATSFAVVCLLFTVSFPLSAETHHARAHALPHARQTATKINLNTADVAALTHSFKGIGAKRAQAIVNYRAAHGNFKSVGGLASVRGLGKSFVSRHLTQLKAIFTVG